MTLNITTQEFWTLKYLLQNEVQRLRLKEKELTTHNKMVQAGPTRRAMHDLENIDYKMAKLIYKGVEDNE